MFFSTPLLNHEIENHPTKVYGDAFEGMYPSVGACDEFIRLFLYHKVMPEKEIVSLEGYLRSKFERPMKKGAPKRLFRVYIYIGDSATSIY